MVAALKEPVEGSDDENDENIETEGDGPLWHLFDQLYNSPNASGTFYIHFITNHSQVTNQTMLMSL